MQHQSMTVINVRFLADSKNLREQATELQNLISFKVHGASQQHSESNSGEVPRATGCLQLVFNLPVKGGSPQLVLGGNGSN